MQSQIESQSSDGLKRWKSVLTTTAYPHWFIPRRMEKYFQLILSTSVYTYLHWHRFWDVDPLMSFWISIYFVRLVDTLKSQWSSWAKLLKGAIQQAWGLHISGAHKKYRVYEDRWTHETLHSRGISCRHMWMRWDAKLSISMRFTHIRWVWSKPLGLHFIMCPFGVV